MIGVVLFVVALSALEAYQWDGGPEDKEKISACVGGNASFPWSVVTGRDGETILNLAWWFQASDKDKGTQIATYQSEHFYTTNTERFAFIPKAGLSLHGAKPQDSGNYSVQVQLRQADLSFTSVGRTVTLSVTERPPATQDGGLHVTMSDAVRDDVTEDWTLQLHCGHFVYLGHPSVGVVWTTPSGEARKSSFEDNGTFVLSVSSPVQGGNYSCHLPPSAPAVRCLAATSPLNAAAQLYVDDKDVRLTFLEAQQQETSAQQQETKTRLSKRIDGLTAQIQDLNRTVDFMVEGRKSSCADWLAVDRQSGVRAIQDARQFIAVYCDQVTDNGGWTVFQRRTDASVDFYRNWTDYRNGFGDLEGNFWLGLDKLHRLTTAQRVELRVDLHKWNGYKGSATYSGFYVDDASHNFTLRLDKFTGGNAGDSLSSHRGYQFSTKDRDNDSDDYNCAQSYHGAWWYYDCHWSNLNGVYQNNGSVIDTRALIWYHFGAYKSMKFTEMKFRPM